MGGRGGMITTPISLQDLRRRIYVMAKTDKTNRGFGWKRWSTAWFHERLGLFGDYRVLLGCARKRSWSIGHITHGAKRTGERRTGNPSAPFDEAGAGDGLIRAPRQSSTLRVASVCSTNAASSCEQPSDSPLAPCPRMTARSGR